MMYFNTKKIRQMARQKNLCNAITHQNKMCKNYCQHTLNVCFIHRVSEHVHVLTNVVIFAGLICIVAGVYVSH
jgi:uncharacterized NAD(P)/FAD-binding protein YdhS